MKNEKRRIRHHYIPKCLQRRFTDNGRNLYYAQRQSGKFDAIEYRNIDSVFKVKDLYTVLIDGKSSDVVEKQFYAAMDDALAKFLTSVDEFFESKFAPVFDESSLENLIELVTMFYRRTPYAWRLTTDEELGHEFADRLSKYHESQWQDFRDLAERLIARDPQTIKRQGRDIRVRAGIMPLSDDIRKVLKSFTVRWAQPARKSSFVLTSNALFTLDRPGGLRHPTAQIWFPVAPKLSLVLVRDQTGAIPVVSRIDDRTVRELNEFSVSRAQAVASHSPELLCSLLNQSLTVRMRRNAK